MFRDAECIDALPAFRCVPVRPRRATAMHGTHTSTPHDDLRCARQIDDPGSGRAIRRHSRFIPDGRLAPVGLVRHACTSSFRTNPIARMERKAARSRRLDKRRSEWPGRSAIHVCNTTRCDSVCFHSLVPVSDTSDPLKRSPDRLRPRPRSRPAQICKERTMLHAARPRGSKRAIDAHRAPANSANVSKLKRLPDRLRRPAEPSRRTRPARANSATLPLRGPPNGLQSPHCAA